YIALRNGDFISDDYIYTSDLCYDRMTGEIVDEEADAGENSEEAQASACDSIQKKVEKELNYSDDLIYGDLFRFVDFRKRDRKSTRLNSSHVSISYAVFCLKKKILKKRIGKGRSYNNAWLVNIIIKIRQPEGDV